MPEYASFAITTPWSAVVPGGPDVDDVR